MVLNLIFLVIVAFLTVGFFWVRKQYRFCEENGIPYVKPTFPLGNLWGAGYKIHICELLQEIYTKTKGKHVIAGLYMFVYPIYLTLDLDFIKHVFVKDFHHFHDRGVYVNEKDDPLSGHLFSLAGQRWKNMRSKLSPTFTSGKMKMMHSTFVAVAKELQKHLDPIAERKQEIEIKDTLAKYTTDVIGNTAFGVECNSFTQPNSQFRTIGKKVFDLGKFEFLKQIMAGAFPNISRALKVKVTKPEVEEFFMRLLRETTRYREKHNVQRNDFLSLLMQIMKTGKLEGDNTELGKITFEELAAQTFLFFIAGFETSSSTMTFALYELAQHQDLQDKARNEVLRILAKYNGEYTYEACMEMKYMDQVINETLRKYPVAETLVRSTTSDYKLPNHDFVIKKGSGVLISVYSIHHDPEIYPDPERFDPERFTEEEIAKRHPMAWLPFGEGPRMCVGMRFGMMQTRVGLANFLEKYRIRTTPKTPIPIVIAPNSNILAAKGGIWLQIEKI